MANWRHLRMTAALYAQVEMQEKNFWTVERKKEKEGGFLAYVQLHYEILSECFMVLVSFSLSRNSSRSLLMVTRQKLYFIHSFNHFFLLFPLKQQQQKKTINKFFWRENFCFIYYFSPSNEPSINSRCLLLCPTIRRTGARPTDVEWLHGPTLSASTANAVSPR